MFDFKDQVVVVTGAAGALGSVVAKQFDGAGANVILVDIAKDRLSDVVGDMSDRAVIKAVDLTNEDQVSELYSTITNQFGKVDVLANIAGGFTMGGRTHETELDTFDKMIDMNTRTMYISAKSALEHMIDQDQGRIINIGAPAGQEGSGNMGPYCASKSMVIRLTESMAKEYKDDNINVNCILPGTIDTEQNRQDMPGADFDSWVKPEQLANVIMFLASPAADAVSSAAIPVLGDTL